MSEEKVKLLKKNSPAFNMFGGFFLVITVAVISYFYFFAEDNIATSIKQDIKSDFQQSDIQPTKSKTVPQISNEEKGLAIQSIKGYPEVQDAAVVQEGTTLSLAIVVNYGTSKEKAKERGEDFVRMVKTFSKDKPPTNEVGDGIYDYLIGVYYPDETQVITGAKVRFARKISW